MTADGFAMLITLFAALLLAPVIVTQPRSSAVIAMGPTAFDGKATKVSAPNM
jgi:hypothetical protein